jgi:outer membrane protein, heavy metal efflux system
MRSEDVAGRVRFRNGLAVAIASSVFFGACASYHPVPLDQARLDAALASPDAVELAQEAARLRHPAIPPLVLDFTKPLTGRELGVIAVLANPDLKALRAQEGVADAQVFRAGLLPDPQLSAGLDHPLNDAPDLVNAYSMGIDWDLAGAVLRGSTRRIAEADRAKIRYDLAWQEWLAANQARLLGIRLCYLEKREELARSAADSAERILEITRRNLARGDARIDEFGLRQVGYLDAKDRALSLARDVEKTRQDLNGELGFPPDRHFRVASATPGASRPLKADELFAEARRQRLDLVALQAGYQAQEARVYQEVLRQYPAFTLGVNRARDTSNVRTLGFTIGLTLPVFDRNRGGIAVARATREQLYAEYVSRLQKVRADIASLAADLIRIRSEREVLSEQLPELEKAERTMRDAVASGDVTLLVYETVRSAVLDKKLSLLSLEQSTAEQKIGLQIAVGAPWKR